jgi:hypothetical protein
MRLTRPANVGVAGPGSTLSAVTTQAPGSILLLHATLDNHLAGARLRRSLAPETAMGGRASELGDT